MSLNEKRAILEYWTLVEFFSPYLLDHFFERLDSCQRVFADEVSLLPWSEERELVEEDPKSTMAKGYHLYLGVFSIEETADRARHVFHEKPNVWESIDWRQCGSPSTLSCFARLTLTKFGAPLLGSLSLSTLPWAHGRLLNREQEFLTMESYWKGVQRLLSDLREKWVETLPHRPVRLPKESAAILDYKALCALSEYLFQWAGYHPKEYPIALIEPLHQEENRVARDPRIDSERDIPILNSFYIAELERARVSLESQQGQPLDLYLGGERSDRILLEREEGKRAILDALMPSKLPQGRWPTKSSNQLALMQQFVVNVVLSSSEKGSLFSVNGPPGTGKTTLLREMIADNIVRRANALAQFSKAREAFTGRRAMSFGERNAVHVSDLHHSLLGYEMLVVSSNNAAVENLSNELPLCTQLDSSYGHASYLGPVACKLLKGAWGLISGALGNRENCRRLVESVFIKCEENEEETRIWDWAQKYNGKSFAEAKEKFLALQKERQAIVDDLETLAMLHVEIAGGKLKARVEKVEQELEALEKKASQLELQLGSFQKEEEELQELYHLLEQKAKLWEKQRPHLVDQLVKGKNWTAWSEKSSQYTQELITAVDALHKQKGCVRELRTEINQLSREIEEKEYELLECLSQEGFYQEDYERLKETYTDVRLPEGIHELDDHEIQKQPYYQNAALNHIRSELFLAAMTVHEAWFAETLRPNGGFRGNLLAISHLLQGKNPTTADDTRLAWQSLFLVIPVLSSTFASVGRLFRCLEPQTLGWVFIDEAGQATPQAAVGAIWRAKHVVSTGDPFQIEPISTVPPEIVDGMAKFRLQDHSLSWASSQVSVQNLMDAAAKYAAKRDLDELPRWLGSPLRVHRRCEEPMFSISNEIAYDKHMVLATPSDSSFPLKQSCWYDVKGEVKGRQYIPAQGEMLVQCLQEALNGLSSPDLFVIAPFREVVQHIHNLLSHEKGLKKIFETRFQGVALRSWMRDSIGTVHAFQGKQAGVVFFVLGADKTTLGSIEWVTRKPNLLNVAVTRARHRFYVIGDYDLWRGWPYFNVAARKLPRKLGT